MCSSETLKCLYVLLGASLLTIHDLSYILSVPLNLDKVPLRNHGCPQPSPCRPAPYRGSRIEAPRRQSAHGPDAAEPDRGGGGREDWHCPPRGYGCRERPAFEQHRHLRGTSVGVRSDRAT